MPERKFKPTEQIPTTALRRSPRFLESNQPEQGNPVSRKFESSKIRVQKSCPTPISSSLQSCLSKIEKDEVSTKQKETDIVSKRLKNLSKGIRRYMRSDGRADMRNNGKDIDLGNKYVKERRVTRRRKEKVSKKQKEMDTGSKMLENLTTGSRRYATSDGRAKMKNGEGMDLGKQYVIERRVTRSLTRENRNVNVEVTDCVPTNDCSKRARVLSDEEKAKLGVNLSEQFARKAEKRVIPWPSRVTFNEHFEKGTNDSTECLNKVKAKESLPKQSISKFDNREWDAIMAGGDEKEGNGCKGKTLIHENRNRSRIEEEHSIVQGWTKEQDLALQRAYFTEKPTPDFWKKVVRMENRKYAKYKNMNCSEIYDMFGKLFSDTDDSTKYVMSPTKLLQRGFDLGTDSDQEDEGDKLPINAEGTDSSDSPVEHRGHLSMNISKRRSGDKRNYRHGKDKGKRKSYCAREVSISLEQMVSVGTDLVSSARLYQKDDMSIDECVSELLSSGHVEEGSPLHIFALWFFRVKENRSSYCAAKTQFLRFKFIEYCFERDN